MRPRIPVFSTSYNNGNGFAFIADQQSRLLTKELNMDRMNPIAAFDKGPDHDLFDGITEEEIIGLWRSIRGRGMSGDEAWQAIVTGIALDMAFAKSRAFMHTDH